MSTVKSWVFTKAGYPATLSQQTTSLPSSPSPHHVLIQIKAAALNPVDIQLMNVPLNSLPYFNGPKTSGRDFSGIILAAAPDTPFQKGDEVMGVDMDFFASGTLTEVSHLDVRKSVVVKKPAQLDWIKAASLPLVWLTARTCIEKCAPYLKAAGEQAGRIVVLGGSSAVGMYTIRLAKERGWTVLTSCSGRNIDFVKGKGADEVVDYTASPDAVVKAVSAFKPNAIIDCVGGTECIGLAKKYVTIVGDKTSRATMGGSVLYYFYPRMYLRWLIGYLGLGPSYECIMLDQNKEYLEKATELKGDDVEIDSVFEFEEVKKAYERLNTGRARGKVVVKMSE